jgi:hypothetical protein
MRDGPSLEIELYDSWFAQIFRHKMDCIPHFWQKNADKTAFLPHSAKKLEIKTKSFSQSECRLVFNRIKPGVLGGRFFKTAREMSEPRDTMKIFSPILWSLVYLNRRCSLKEIKEKQERCSFHAMRSVDHG